MKGKKIIKTAKKSMKILKSGKIQIGDSKIDLRPIISESSESAVISRLDGIISKEEAAVEDSKCNIEYMLQPQLKSAELSSIADKKPYYDTVVIILPKKASISVFDFLNTGTIGDLLRSSTLSISYTKVKKEWVNLNKDDETEFTNILYIPDVFVFLDPESGKFKAKPYRVNVLICAVPSYKKIAAASETEIERSTALMRMIGDTLEAGIRLGCKELVIDPFQIKALRKDVSETSKLWNTAVSSQRIQNNFDEITFSFISDGEFAVFAGNK